MVANGPDVLPKTRVSLLEKLRQWDNDAGWREFFEIYWMLIYRTALRAGLSEAEAEEVVQETIISVSKAMPGFKYRPRAEGGSFKKWLFRLTQWRVGHQLRKRLPDGPRFMSDSVDDEALAEIEDPTANPLESLWNAEWDRNLVHAAIEKVKDQVDARHFQAFHLVSVEHWPAWKVARRLRLSLPGVYTAKHRVESRIKDTLETLRAATG